MVTNKCSDFRSKMIKTYPGDGSFITVILTNLCDLAPISRSPFDDVRDGIRFRDISLPLNEGVTWLFAIPET